MRHCAAGATGAREGGQEGALGGGFGVGVAAGSGNWEENERNDSNPRNSFIYSVRAHMSADLRVCGFGYQNFKPISRYPLDLELYPRPRVQT